MQHQDPIIKETKITSTIPSENAVKVGQDTLGRDIYEEIMVVEVDPISGIEIRVVA